MLLLLPPTVSVDVVVVVGTSLDLASLPAFQVDRNWELDIPMDNANSTEVLSERDTGALVGFSLQSPTCLPSLSESGAFWFFAIAKLVY